MDRRDKQLQLRAFILVLGILLVACLGWYAWDYKDAGSVEEYINGETISFSEETGFYNDSVSLKLKTSYEAPLGTKIYYTLDGNDPNENSTVYSGEILLEAIAGDIVVYPIKVRLWYKGTFSSVIEHTYVIGTSISERFDIKVISLTCDSENLYNPANGIFLFPRNRGDEWTRDAHITMFEHDGSILWNQDVGLNVAGGTSSRMEVKSFKITADSIFDEANPKLKFDDYYKRVTNSEWSLVNEYNSMKLKSGAQDMQQGNIRSAVVSRLANESGFAGCTDTDRAVLYFNGRFYGIFDIQQQYSNSFLANKFNLDVTDSIEKLEGSEQAVFSSSGILEIFKSDLNQKENREKLEQNVDMDDFFLYYAIEILTNNTDWPQNNYQIWRYTGTKDETNKYTDGRWRFLIYDTDLTYYSSDNIPFFEGADVDIFEALLEGTWRAEDSIFANVMKSEVYRDKFITVICDLLNHSFDTDNVLNIIDEEFAKIKAEQYVQYGKEEGDKISRNYIGWMRREAEEREGEIREILKRYLGVNEEYEFSMTTTEGIQVVWGNNKIFEQEKQESIYYSDVEFLIAQVPYPGYKFSHWLVNGEKVEQDVLKITKQYISDGKISVTAVAEREAEDKLIIVEVAGKSEADWIKLCNVGQTAMALNKYYISDSMSTLMQYQLPNLMLKPGESIIINGTKNYYAIGDYICNFSLNQFETVYLYNSNSREIEDSVSVPRMEANETYGRYKNSQSFVFFKNNTNERNVSTY